MYCKHAEFACKLQKNLPMTNKTCHSMQSKCKIVFWICRICRYLQKSFSWSAKKSMITQNDRICKKKMLSSSADTRTPRLLTSNMYVHVHICNIYSAYICVYNAVFGGYHSASSTFHYRGKYRGKIPDEHSKPIYLVLKPLKLQNYWRIFGRPVSSMVLQIFRICM